MTEKRRTLSWLLFFFLLFLIAMSYSNTLYSPFILDDLSSFVKNRNLYLQDFSFDSFAKLADTRFGFARLLPITTFALNHSIGKGESIAIYHVTNILVHLLATISLAGLVSGILKTNVGRSSLKFFHPHYFILAVCGIWALSPVQTNAVTYLVQRMTSMAAMFYMAACAFYIYGRLSKIIWHKAILFSFCLLGAICAFLSKENSATLPAAILLIEFMFVTPDLGSNLLKSSRWYHWCFILMVVILIFPIVENFLSGSVAGSYGRHFTATERMLTQLRIVIFYVSLLLLPLPSRMNLEHDFSLSSSLISPPATILSLLILILLLATAFRYTKKYPLISFGIFWFYLNLIIESSFIPLELIFEHRLYLPSIGLFLALLSTIDIGLDKYATNSHPEIKKIIFLIFLILLSASSVLTSVRNNHWSDKLTFYLDSMQKSPDKARAVSNYAMALGKAGHYEECVKYGTLVQSLGEQGYEDYLSAATNTLSCLILQGKYEEAIEKGELFRHQILQKDMDFIEGQALPKFMFNLGRAYAGEDQYLEAYEAFLTSLFRMPDHFPTFLAINNILLYAQKDEQGRKDFGIGEEIFEVPLYLSKVAYKYRQYGWAQRYLEDAGRLGAPVEETEEFKEILILTVNQNRKKAWESNIKNNPTYKNNFLFRFYLKSVNFILAKYKPLQGAAAGRLLDRAESIDAGNPFIPVYRARWKNANGQADEAIAILEDYRKKDENFVPVLEMLGITYNQQKDYEKSVGIIENILKIYHGNGNWVNYLSYIYQNDDRINKTKRTPLDYY